MPPMSGFRSKGAPTLPARRRPSSCSPRTSSVLAEGVPEGRRTLANIMKYVRMGTSSNFGNMLSMALASLVLPFLPLLPLQILLNNLIYDLSEIGIPFDTVDESDARRAAVLGHEIGAALHPDHGAAVVAVRYRDLFLLRWGFGAGSRCFALHGSSNQSRPRSSLSSSSALAKPWASRPPSRAGRDLAWRARGRRVHRSRPVSHLVWLHHSCPGRLLLLSSGSLAPIWWPRKPASTLPRPRHGARGAPAGLEAFWPARPQLLAQDQGIRPRSCAIMNISSSRRKKNMTALTRSSGSTTRRPASFISGSRSGDDEIVLHPHLPTRHLHHKAGSIGSGRAAPDEEFLAQVMQAVSDAGEVLIDGSLQRQDRSPPATSAITIQRVAIGSPASRPPTIRATARSSPMPGSTFESNPRAGAPARP